MKDKVKRVLLNYNPKQKEKYVYAHIVKVLMDDLISDSQVLYAVDEFYSDTKAEIAFVKAFKNIWNECFCEGNKDPTSKAKRARKFIMSRDRFRYSEVESACGSSYTTRNIIRQMLNNNLIVKLDRGDYKLI